VRDCRPALDSSLMGDDSVLAEAISEVGDALAENVDVLLERLTDKVLASPVAGSRDWHSQWHANNSSHGQHMLRQRLLVKIAMAHRAGIDPVHDVDRGRRAGTTWVAIGRAAGLSSRAARQRWATTHAKDRQRNIGQLAMW